MEIDSLRLDLGNINYSEAENQEEEIVLAICGNTFEILYKLKNKFLLTNDKKYRDYYDIFRFTLSNAKIYARMSPDHKLLLIETLKESNLTVAMCGDGVNDMAALRASHVGLSLSPEEIGRAHV